MDITTILSHLQGVTGPDAEGRYLARCPQHDDRTPSLRVFADGGALCFGPCDRSWTPAQFAELLGLAQPLGRNEARAIDRTYDYVDHDGRLLFQVVRFAGKSFSQRRPDPARPGEWVYNLRGVTRVLYRLPELSQADPTETVFIVEGEKDTDRLQGLGLVATTNAMGAGKWRPEYNASLAGRHVAIVPDHDDAGQKHAGQVAKALYPVAASLVVLDLPGLSEHGDVSDWLDRGGAPEQLRALAAAAPPFYAAPPPPVNGNGHGDPQALKETVVLWEGSRLRPASQRIIREGLMKHGDLIHADGVAYYFDYTTRLLCSLDGFAIKRVLNRDYGINAAEALFKYIKEDILVETWETGKEAMVRTFSYYDAGTNHLYLDTGSGQMLRLNGKHIELVDNGTDGILFTPADTASPWTFQEREQPHLLGDTLVRPLTFASGDDTPHTAEEQRVLFTVWLLSLAFESVQPTKPLLLAVGPAGSGKSNLMRRVGQLLFGPAFNVDVLRKDGERDFFVATTHSAFCAFDNVDHYVPWLEDALAASATGMKYTTRAFFTTNDAATFTPHAFLGLTARTPKFRREDVAERLVLLRLEKLNQKRSEYELLQEVLVQRNALLSEYARLLNKVLAVGTPQSVDPSIRLADFASVASRIGEGLGIADRVAEALSKMKQAQHQYAVEEHDLYRLLDVWLDGHAPPTSQQALAPIPNAGRAVNTKALHAELRAIAERENIKWYYASEVALGRQLQALEDALGVAFAITHGRTNQGKTWCFERLEGASQ